MFWPREVMKYPLEIGAKQLWVCKAAGHVQRLLGVDQRLLLHACML